MSTRIAALLATAAICLLAICLGGCRAPTVQGKQLVVWGLQFSPEDIQLEAQVREFERRTGIRVKVLSMGAGQMNPQKLMTAIVGRTPPDVIFQDRFTIGDWASRDTFMPLDELLRGDAHLADGVKAANFYPATWLEASYQGKVYAIPAGCDDRCLMWNKRLFRENAEKLRRAGCDSNRPPRTWSELKAYAVALTDRTPDGSYRSIGFIPNYGNSWLYLYSWQNDGEFMSSDGRACTLTNANTVGALKYMVEIYDALGGMDQVNKFQSGFRGNEQDPFFSGRVAMKIDGDWSLSGIARYGPQTEFGVAPAPVPDERYRLGGRFAGKDRFVTWAGGFSYAIPVGISNVADSWRFIRWMTSVEAARFGAQAQRELMRSKGRLYVPRQSANMRVNEMLFAEFAPADPKFRDGLRVFIDMMPHARFRPVTFVGQLLWDEHVRAFEKATYHATNNLTAEQALAYGQERVQRELDKVFSRDRVPVLNWKVPIAVVLAALLALGVFLWVRWGRHIRLGRLGRAETAAGYAFISPWLFGFAVFTAGPIVASVVLSLCDYDVLHPARWVGLGNYAELLTYDFARLALTIKNATFLAAIGIPLNIATGLAIAMLLNTGVRGMAFYRTAYYMPSIVPVIASAVLWSYVLQGDPNQGLINAGWKATLTEWFGWLPPGWLASPIWAKPALIVMGLWGAGGGMILWLAGLQGVPQHLYEAANIDGATPWKAFLHVTLPQLSPYLFFNVIMGTIGALQEFDRVYVLGGSGAQIGPDDSLLMPVYYLFNNGFAYFKMGYASAIAWILFVLVLALTVIQLKLAPRWVHYEN